MIYQPGDIVYKMNFIDNKIKFTKLKVIKIENDFAWVNEINEEAGPWVEYTCKLFPSKMEAVRAEIINLLNEENNINHKLDLIGGFINEKR